MRSKAEVVFRARQEIANFYLLLAQSSPSFRGDIPLSLELPEVREIAAALQGSLYALEVQDIAEKIMVHRFPVLGIELDTGRGIHWRRDYVNHTESGTAYFRRIAYLDFSKVGDHKIVWELNRHQHLVLLAQAYWFTSREEYKSEVIAQLESWFEQNRFQHGINWASALEVAFRTLSWIWVYHFLAPQMPGNFRRRFLIELYRHGRYLRENLSVYFSPNTHLLGEAVALHALGKLFTGFREAEDWESRGATVVQGQLEFQVQKDGSHFEQSTYYHVYALDFFVLHYLLAGRPESYRPVLLRMAEYLFWLLGPHRRISFLGDDDGGRLFHPYGPRDQFGRASLATCGVLFDRLEWVGTKQDLAEQAVWWIGSETLRLGKEKPLVATTGRAFSESGSVFLHTDDLSLQMDCGPFGWAGAGHSHSDSLSLLLSYRGERVLVDPGTYTYVGDPQSRNWFRGSAAHNTVRIDGLDQAKAAGPFRWASKPRVSLIYFEPTSSGGLIEAVCSYEQFTHRRRVMLEPGRLMVWDEIEAESHGEHTCEQIWQLGQGARSVDFLFSAPATRSPSQISPAYAAKFASTSLIVKVTRPLPLQMGLIIRTPGTGAVFLDETCLQECATAWGTHAAQTARRYS